VLIILQSANIPGKVQYAFDAWQADNIGAYFLAAGFATGSVIEFNGGHWKKGTVMLGFVCLQNARNGKRLGQALFQIVARLGFTNTVSFR
jgi:hypothetical protein